MPLQHTWLLEQFDAFEQSIVVPMQVPLGTQDGVIMRPPPAPAPPPPVKLARRAAMLNGGVQHVIPLAHSGLPAVMPQGIAAGPLSLSVEVLASALASVAGGVFEDELHANTESHLPHDKTSTDIA
jgi:hypothetical protein